MRPEASTPREAALCGGAGWCRRARRRRPAPSRGARRALGSAGLAALLFAGWGCPGPITPPTESRCDTSMAPAAAERVEPGVTDDGGRFVALAGGESLHLLRGVQGGRHVELAVRLFARSHTQWEHTLGWYAPSGERVGGTIVDAEACVPGWTVTSGIRAFYDGPIDTSSTAARLELRSAPVDDPTHVLTSPPLDVRLYP